MDYYIEETQNTQEMKENAFRLDKQDETCIFPSSSQRWQLALFQIYHYYYFFFVRRRDVWLESGVDVQTALTHMMPNKGRTPLCGTCISVSIRLPSLKPWNFNLVPQPLLSSSCLPLEKGLKAEEDFPLKRTERRKRREAVLTKGWKISSRERNERRRKLPLDEGLKEEEEEDFPLMKD